jgi:acyl-homoserine-lactone acylase
MDTRTLRVTNPILWTLLLLVTSGAGVSSVWAKTSPGRPAAEIVRDSYGVPHIFARTIEDAAFAIGYAQSEDRLEELLRNYRKAEGTMAEVFGPEWFRHDYRQRLWRHAEISRERYASISPLMRRAIESYQEGIKRYMAEHPERVPTWAPALHPAQVLALGRYIIWGWPEGEAGADLRRGGINPDPVNYRGSNQMLLAPKKTAMKAPIAIIDPHLGWYGEFRFYEVRIYAGDFKVSGVSILGIPFPSLGHSRWASIAMTTGGPDTSDVYEEEIDPGNPRQYRFNGGWSAMTMRREKILVKRNNQVLPSEVELEYTHHGPVVARRDGKAYTMAIPYLNEVGLIDQIYQMFTSRNLKEMKQALSNLQLMSQNIMIGTVDGDIYYLRNGRVPIRPRGCDTTRPMLGTGTVSGAGSARGCEWQGLHRLDDLVQISNPPQGYMQNNNSSPAFLLKESPLRAEKYRDHPYLFNDGNTAPHQRAAMTLDQLHAANGVTIDQAIDLAYSPQVWKAEDWQSRIERAWKSTPSNPQRAPADSVAVFEQISRWNRRSDPDSVGALAFFAFKSSLEPSSLRPAVEVPDSLTDTQILKAIDGAASWLRSRYSSVVVPFGRLFRVGREGGVTYPVGGGTLTNVGMATPRAISFAERGVEMVGLGGQTSTQVVVLSKIPESYSIIPLGMSDDRGSIHWDDQAAKLFSRSYMKPTWFMRRGQLMKHVTRRQLLSR